MRCVIACSHAEVDLVIVSTHAEARRDSRIVGCSDGQRAERCVELAAVVDARQHRVGRSRGSLNAGIGQDAVRNEVVVVVGPRARRAVLRRVHPVVERGHVGRFALHVFGPVHARDGPAVAEDVVGAAEARREVLPVRHVVDLVVVPRGDERNGRQVLGRHIRVVIVEPQAQVERQALDRPAILRVGPSAALRCSGSMSGLAYSVICDGRRW